MKFSNRNFKSLSFLENPNGVKFSADAEDEPFLKSFVDNQLLGNAWKGHYEDFKNNVCYITKPFSKAALIAQNKMMEFFKKEVLEKNESIKYSGTQCIGPITYFFLCHSLPEEDDIDRCLLMFSNEGHFIGFYIDSNRVSAERSFCFLSNEYRRLMKVGFAFDEMVAHGEKMLGFCLSIELFRLHADVETVIVGAKSRTSIACKYVNECNVDIRCLDSKWFTTLVLSEAFNVRGHFRWQPFGTGMADRKLIWINEFTKTGYRREAQILKGE